MDKNRKKVIEENEISEMYTFSLGQVPQKVLIEGKSKELPVVVNLHGGPGTPLPFSAGCRGLFPAFTDRFIMVYWDQLGCGINDYKLKDQFTIASFVRMTEDLLKEVRNLFPSNKIILLGISWGSVLALKAAQNTEADAVVVWGQVLRKLFLNDEVYEALEKAGFSQKKMQRIRAITPCHFNDKDMQFLAGSVRKYTNGYNNKNGKSAPKGGLIKGLLTSPDYQFKDFKAIIKNGTATSTCLWPELLQLDLTEELTKIKIPYYILQGDTDIVTSTQDILKEVNASGNSYLHCEVIRNSGHLPGKEGMDAVFDALVDAADS